MSNIDTCQLELSLCTLVAATAVFNLQVNIDHVQGTLAVPHFICRRLCWTLSLRSTCAGQSSQSSQSHSYQSTGQCKLPNSNSLPSRSQHSPPPLLSIPTATQTHQIGMVRTPPRGLSCQIRIPQMRCLARAHHSALVIMTQTGLIRAPRCSPHQAHHDSLIRTRQGSSDRTNSRCLIRIQEEYLIRICYSPCSGAPHSCRRIPPARLM